MKENILIFDDDVDILEVCKTILQLKGYNVLCKDNCRSMFEDIEGFEPAVIMMDNQLPDLGGVKATQQIKKHEKYKYIPVIFFSAHNYVEELATEAHADYVLKKPFDIEQLEFLLSTALKKAAANS